MAGQPRTRRRPAGLRDPCGSPTSRALANSISLARDRPDDGAGRYPGSPAITERAEDTPDIVIVAMAPKPGDVVADLGAGSGYFSFRIAPEVAPDGAVPAVRSKATCWRWTMRLRGASAS